MTDRAAGKARWGKEEKDLVDAYFNRGPAHRKGIDPSQIHRCSYLNTLREKEPLWSRLPQKNFNMNIRTRRVLFSISRSYPYNSIQTSEVLVPAAPFRFRFLNT